MTYNNISLYGTQSLMISKIVMNQTFDFVGCRGEQSVRMGFRTYKKCNMLLYTPLCVILHTLLFDICFKVIKY